MLAGDATAVRTVPAHQDSKLTSMVPANVYAKRKHAQPKTRLQNVPNVDANAGFGLAPQLGRVQTADAGDAAYASFMDEIANL